MAKYYRSEDEAPIVESPVTDDEGQVIAATATTEPDLPPAGPIEPISDVESTREPEADPTVPEQRFRQEGEEVEAAPAPEAPAEAPAEPAPMDAPAEVPAADAAPAEAPVAPAPEGVPAAPADAPVADVPAAAPMVPPQPEAEVVPVAPAEGEVAPAAPVAPEVEAPTAPVDQPVEDAPVQCSGGKGGKGFKQEDGEEISVVETPEPTMPADTESETCPETGNEYVTKDVNEPINPVISQDDEIADDANNEGDEAGGTVPAETGKTDDITAIEPDAAETQDEAIAEVDEATMSFRQAFRMEGEAEVEAGDQDVNATVNVNVRKDDGDEHADDTAETGTEVSDNGDQTPTQYFRQEGEETAVAPETVETVADVTKVETGEAPEDKVVDAAVPDPIDPNAGNPDPEQCFQSFMQEGGSWL